VMLINEGGLANFNCSTSFDELKNSLKKRNKEKMKAMDARGISLRLRSRQARSGLSSAEVAGEAMLIGSALVTFGLSL
jgi:hypothetical protein